MDEEKTDMLEMEGLKNKAEVWQDTQSINNRGFSPRPMVFLPPLNSTWKQWLRRATLWNIHCLISLFIAIIVNIIITWIKVY